MNIIYVNSTIQIKKKLLIIFVIGHVGNADDCIFTVEKATWKCNLVHPVKEMIMLKNVFYFFDENGGIVQCCCMDLPKNVNTYAMNTNHGIISSKLCIGE